MWMHPYVSHAWQVQFHARHTTTFPDQALPLFGWYLPNYTAWRQIRCVNTRCNSWESNHWPFDRNSNILTSNRLLLLNTNSLLNESLQCNRREQTGKQRTHLAEGCGSDAAVVTVTAAAAAAVAASLGRELLADDVPADEVLCGSTAICITLLSPAQ